MKDFEPIETAPKNRLLQGYGPGIDFYRMFWDKNKWRMMEWDIEVKPTHWRHNLPEHRNAP